MSLYIYETWSWHTYSYAFGFLLKTECDSSLFGFITQAINSSGDSINKASNFSSYNTGSIFIQSDIVGEKKKIMDMLIKKADVSVGSKGNNDVVVAVAITGTGGIGKTTLAQMIFGDTRVKESFEERIWLSINQDVDEISVLQSLLAFLVPNMKVVLETRTYLRLL